MHTYQKTNSQKFLSSGVYADEICSFHKIFSRFCLDLKFVDNMHLYMRYRCASFQFFYRVLRFHREYGLHLIFSLHIMPYFLLCQKIVLHVVLLKWQDSSLNFRAISRESTQEPFQLKGYINQLSNPEQQELNEPLDILTAWIQLA